jgi:hypothetical protein
LSSEAPEAVSKNAKRRGMRTRGGREDKSQQFGLAPLLLGEAILTYLEESRLISNVLVEGE